MLPSGQISFLSIALTSIQPYIGDQTGFHEGPEAAAVKPVQPGQSADNPCGFELSWHLLTTFTHLFANARSL